MPLRLRPQISRERAAMLAIWTAAAAACALGKLHPPPQAAGVTTLGRQLVDLLRVVTTAALAITLVLGPGILLRRLSGRRIGLGFTPLVGLSLLVLTGLLAWLLAPGIDPRHVCAAVVGVVLVILLGSLLAGPQEDLLSSDEHRILIWISFALGLAIARSLWSIGPLGELYDGTVARTLNVEPRPDSAISYLVAEMVAHGSAPYGPAASGLFLPYNFSSRGPFPGMASAPIMLLTGARVPLGAPFLYPWQPFDAQGFMAYRIAMMTFSCTALLSVWELVRTVAGAKAGRFAVLFAATTPFVLNDMWFTWPKLLAASFVILAATLLIRRKAFRSGLLVTIGYLMHPSAALGLSGLAPIALWPTRAPRWRRPRISMPVLLLIGTGIGVEGWKIYNGVHYMQTGFADYIREAFPYYYPTIGQWIHFRLNVLGDTLVPFYLPIREAHSISINALNGTSPFVVHFFFQYWTGVPFAFGISFFPFLLALLWRAARRWPWPFTGTIVLPFVAFFIYWGASVTGLLREGMQAWVLAVIAFVALELAASNFTWLRSRVLRAVLVLRVLEVLAVAVGATLGTRDFALLSSGYTLNDTVAVAAMVGFTALLMIAVWRETGRLAAEA